MSTLNRIVMASDFSNLSKTAAAFALELAPPGTLDAYLVTVDETKKSAEGELKSKLDGVAAELREHWAHVTEAASSSTGTLRITQEVLYDRRPSTAVLSYAADADADLITTGTRGHRGVRRAFLGSVASELIRESPCPVLTVREVEGTKPGAAKHIAVPVDFSDPSKAAVRYAADLADRLGARLTLVYVMEKEGENAGYGFKPSVFGTAAGYKRARKDLRGLAEGLPVEASVKVLDGKPADALLSYADAKDLDLIVMSTRGYSGVKRLLEGSVAEDIITRAACPVLVARDFASQADAVPAAGTEEAA
ncbi:MAG: universal stress protein [Bacteroidetes bacterium]|jgi:nucleotide-binding universal stress UspA family protein|nr:universal stress protein [Bacteroidota bacterium]